MLRYASQAGYYARNGVLPFMTICLVAAGVNDKVVEINAITGRSMQPTLSPNFHLTGEKDYVCWKKWQPTKNLQRGDVVLFNNPTRPDVLTAKRIIALGGDTVLLNTRRRPKDVENGRSNEAARLWDAQFYNTNGRITIPPGHVWVEGDNAEESRDSNTYGPISRSLIIGKASRIFLPVRQFWTKPWTQWNGKRTKVVPGREVIPGRNDVVVKPLWEAS